MRILHSIRSVNPAGGGPIEGLKQISAVNLKNGHKVEVVSLDAPSDPWVGDCPIKCYALGPSWGKYGYSRTFATWLSLNADRYDAVVVNGIWQYNAFGVWRGLRNSGVPYFVYTHGMLDPWFKRRYPLKHLKKWLYWPWADYRVLRDASAVLFTCEEERRLARKSFWLYKCREYVAHYGTAGPSGDRLRQEKLFLDRFPALAGKRYLLFLGRVHEKKGADLLFKAYAELIKEVNPVILEPVFIVMAGPSNDGFGNRMKRYAVELGIDARIVWTGMLTGDLKWGAFYNANAFVLPSHQENFGIAVVEALACGVPVLISDQVNIWREIREDGAGFVEGDSLHGVKNLLLRWLFCDLGSWEEMRTQARASFLKRFTVDLAANSLIDALQKTKRGRSNACQE